MWLIRLDGPKPVLLATPEAFSGWLFAVLTAMSHGYPDIVTGWHMGAAETGLKRRRLLYWRQNRPTLISTMTAKVV